MPRYRVTGAGWLFALALMVAGAAAFLTANNLLFLVFAAMLALLLVSGSLNRLVLSGLELELLLPEHVAARATTPAQIRLRNVKRFTASFSIELSGRGGQATLERPVYFPLVAGRGTAEAAVDMVFARRGRHRDNVFVLSTRFPFGFIQRATHLELKRETIVYPAINLTPQTEELLRGIEEQNQMRRVAAGQDFYRIRPYVSTDGARQVDWKSTAHTGDLQVREFARDTGAPVRIYLNRFVHAGAEEAFERVLEDCASVVWHLAESGQRIEFADGERELSDAFTILRHLALVEVRTGASPETPADALLFTTARGR